MKDRLRIAILMGGSSAEREVSLQSGTAVTDALRSLNHEVLQVDPVGEWTLPPETDVVFLALHGTYGEDGTVQRELDALGVPFTGCGARASEIAFDKAETKARLRQAGVPTPDYLVVNDPAAPWPTGWSPPVVVKPVCQGSSVGLQFVDATEDWPDGIRSVLKYDRRALVEERVFGKELTVGILDGEGLPVVEIAPRGGLYDYQHKYTSGATDYFCPARIDERTERELQAIGLKSFAAIEGRDYARVDVLLPESGTPMVLEINTLPGMTETSLLPKAAAARGISFVELCRRMVALAMKRSTEGITLP